MVDLDQQAFDSLIARVRSGDEGAAVQLVKLYEPEIRRDVRLRLTDVKLRRTLDSMDICQSVFCNFFAKAAMGQFNFDRPNQLLRLLSTMAKNKVIDRHRREKVRRPRDGGTLNHLDGSENDPVDQQATASQVIQGKEILDLIKAKLSEDEFEIAQLRRQGHTWTEISVLLGQSTEALRKRLSRACDRIFRELGME